MPGFAFSAACTTLYGQSLGAKRPDLAHDFLMKTIKLCILVMAVTTCGLFFGAELIMGLLTPDPEVILHGSVLLRIVALIQIPQGVGLCISGGLQGGGDTRSPLLVSMASVWGVRIVGVLLCVHVFHLGLYAVCVSMCTDNVVRCILFLLRYRQQRHKLAESVL
jgi:Na+-driven multidrug efflux pump